MPKEITLQEIADWYEAKEELAKLKLKEKLMRQTICDKMFAGQLVKSRMTIDNAQVTATPSINLKVDEATYNGIFPELNDLEISAIRIKLEVNKSVYKKLPEDSKLHEAITAKSGMPKLEVKEIK